MVYTASISAAEMSGSLFSYVDLEERIPARHPLRKIRQVVNDALTSLGAEFEALYTDFGRPQDQVDAVAALAGGTVTGLAMAKMKPDISRAIAVMTAAFAFPAAATRWR